MCFIKVVNYFHPFATKPPVQSLNCVFSIHCFSKFDLPFFRVLHQCAVCPKRVACDEVPIRLHVGKAHGMTLEKYRRITSGAAATAETRTAAAAAAAAATETRTAATDGKAATTPHKEAGRGGDFRMEMEEARKNRKRIGDMFIVPVKKTAPTSSPAKKSLSGVVSPGKVSAPESSKGGVERNGGRETGAQTTTRTASSTETAADRTPVTTTAAAATTTTETSRSKSTPSLFSISWPATSADEDRRSISFGPAAGAAETTLGPFSPEEMREKPVSEATTTTATPTPTSRKTAASCAPTTVEKNAAKTALPAGTKTDAANFHPRFIYRPRTSSTGSSLSRSSSSSSSSGISSPLRSPLPTTPAEKSVPQQNQKQKEQTHGTKAAQMAPPPPYSCGAKKSHEPPVPALNQQQSQQQSSQGLQFWRQQRELIMKQQQQEQQSMQKQHELQQLQTQKHLQHKQLLYQQQQQQQLQEQQLQKQKQHQQHQQLQGQQKQQLLFHQQQQKQHQQLQQQHQQQQQMQEQYKQHLFMQQQMQQHQALQHHQQQLYQQQLLLHQQQQQQSQQMLQQQGQVPLPQSVLNTNENFQVRAQAARNAKMYFCYLSTFTEPQQRLESRLPTTSIYRPNATRILLSVGLELLSAVPQTMNLSKLEWGQVVFFPKNKDNACSFFPPAHVTYRQTNGNNNKCYIVRYYDRE